MRHMFLRRTYSTVYVTTDKAFLDMHADYVAGGGHSEHALFVKSLQTKDGHRQVQCGPVNPRPNKKKPKAKAKQSQRLRNMLKASPSKPAASTAAAQVVPNPPMDVKARMQLLPGALAHGAQQPMVRSLAQDQGHSQLFRS